MAGQYSTGNRPTNKHSDHPSSHHATPEMKYAFFRNIEAAGNDWDTVAHWSGDIFLQRPYLQTLELAPPSDVRFGYLVFYADNQPAGIAICQSKHFSAAESISDTGSLEKEPCFFGGLANWLKRRVAGWVDTDILVCGNLMVTGQHGFWFDTEKIAPEQSVPLLYKSLQDSISHFDKNGGKITMLLFKDISPVLQPLFAKVLRQKQFTEFEIQPNMVLHLGEFADFDAYLGAMTTKYRTRAKRAFKKGELLQKKELTRNEILESAPRMFELYKSVAKSAGFNVVDLHETYMQSLHKAMEGTFRIFGYYLSGEMVAYCTTLKNNKELEAHFLGYDKSLNHDYQLYINMLYDMVNQAFAESCTSIVFARTALEIKSSVGAAPENLYCYLKHQNHLINNFTSNILDYLKPVEEWQQRHPFKHLQPEHGEGTEAA